MPAFDVFLFWNVKNVKVDLMVNVKNGIIKCKICIEKHINTSLKDLSIAFKIMVGMAYLHFKVPCLSQFFCN